MNVIVKVTDQVTIEESKTPSRTVHSHTEWQDPRGHAGATVTVLRTPSVEEV